MKTLAVPLIVLCIAAANGCRSEYNPTPPPYCCRPSCQCAPAYNPACADL